MTYLLTIERFDELIENGSLKITPNIFERYTPSKIQDFKMEMSSNPKRKIRIDYNDGIERVVLQECEETQKYQALSLRSEFPLYFETRVSDVNFQMTESIRKRLTERKQVGIIYHYTRVENLLHMVQKKSFEDQELQPFELFSSMIYGVSCTRNSCYSSEKFVPEFLMNKLYVRIALNGNKISDKYKIRPVNGFRQPEDAEILDPWEKSDAERMPLPKKSEQEEFIHFKRSNKPTNTIKMIDYIIDIEILDVHLTEEKKDEILKYSNSFKFPIKIVDKYQNLKP